VGGLPADDPALDGVKREIARRRLAVDPRAACVMYLTIYKVQTGEVKAVACGADLQPMVAVKKAVEDLVDQLGEIVEPVKVARVNPETGVAVLDIGSDSGVKPGDQFVVGPAEAPSAKLEVMVAAGLSSTAKVAEGEKAAVKEGQVARPLTPGLAAGETPPPAKPPAAVPAPAPAKTGG
jgi:hypothetical protein